MVQSNVHTHRDPTQIAQEQGSGQISPAPPHYTLSIVDAQRVLDLGVCVGESTVTRVRVRVCRRTRVAQADVCRVERVVLLSSVLLRSLLQCVGKGRGGGGVLWPSFPKVLLMLFKREGCLVSMRSRISSPSALRQGRRRTKERKTAVFRKATTDEKQGGHLTFVGKCFSRKDRAHSRAIGANSVRLPSIRPALFSPRALRERRETRKEED